MSKYHLKQTIIENAKPVAKEYLLADGNGLFLRVRPTGAKDWLLIYTFARKRNKLGLGSLHTTSLKTARSEAERAHELLAQCVDPKLDRIRREAEEATQRLEAEQLKRRLTVSALFEDWFSAEVQQRKDGGHEVRRTFTKDVLPAIGSRFADEIRRVDSIKILDGVKQRGATTLVRNLLGDMRQMFNYALLREQIQVDPMLGLKRETWGTKNERDRFLDEDEIKLLSCKLPDANLSETTIAVIWLLLATGCRIGEFVQTRWANVNLETGRLFLPKEITKNGVAHTVFLSAFAIKQLETLKAHASDAPFILPARRKHKEVEWAHLSPKFLSKQLADRQRGTDAEPMKNRTQKTDALILPGGHWHAHDLRRSCATLMGHLDVAPHIIEKCLNHVDPNKMQRIYQRQSTQAEQRAAWELVGSRLSILCA